MNVITFTSAESSSVLYACGKCRFTSLDEAHALACCVCPKCGGENRGPGMSWCDVCRQADYVLKVEQRRVADLALPVVEDKGEPVMVGDRFYESADAAAEALWDEDGDPTEVVAHPCTVGKAPTPDIAEYLEEAWGSEFDDPEACDIYIPKDLAAELQKRVEAHAPTTWTPRLNERVVLPAIEAAVAS